MQPGISNSRQVMLRDENNEMDGVAVAHAQAAAPNLKTTWFEDFLGDALPGNIVSTAGSGTGNAAAALVTSGPGGEITIVSASDDGTHAANGSFVALGLLNFLASKGNLVFEARIKVDNITSVAIFVGFSDDISTVELPIYLTGADIDSDATNAAGLIFDTDATTDEWGLGGVKADTDTAPTFSGTAPVNDTYITVRCEIDEDGVVYGYVNGDPIIDAGIAAAITVSTAIAPIIVVANRSASQRTLTIDYMYAQQDR